MSHLTRNIKRVMTYIRSASNLSGTDACLVSEFGFGPGSVCLVSGNISPKITDNLISSGVSVRQEDITVEGIRASAEALEPGSAVIVPISGKSLEELRAFKDSVGMNGYLYIPYPNSSSVVQLFEIGSMPSHDELRNPVPHEKQLSDKDCRLLVFYKEEPGYIIRSVKFNMQRAPEFRVNTLIMTCPEGVKVIKKAGCEEAKAHINRIIANKELMSNAYSTVNVAECILNDKGALDVQFVDGDGLLVGTDLVNDTLEKIRDDIERVFDVILDYKGEPSDFIETEQFRRNFPGIHPDPSQKCFPAVNLDSNIDNFRRVGDKVICYDYEWAVDFPIPIKYVKFRALHFFYRNNIEALSGRFGRIEFIKLFGFDNDEIRVFWAMELCFQHYVEGLGSKGSRF
ncbi:MAG: hypothetical protein IJ757_09450 [Clostridiales bacterium]|nr:hypothetical protein [Clostridiales bacterium]